MNVGIGSIRRDKSVAHQVDKLPKRTYVFSVKRDTALDLEIQQIKDKEAGIFRLLRNHSIWRC